MVITRIFMCMLALLWCSTTRPSITTLKDNLFSLTATSTWREFKPTLTVQPRTPIRETWVLVGKITLKSKDSLMLDELKARWSGGNLGPQVTASLYSKKSRHDQLPIPIEENLICDGIWHPATKEFVFPVQKKLVASDTYYLMVNVDQRYETLLRKGSFDIKHKKSHARLQLKK